MLGLFTLQEVEATHCHVLEKFMNTNRQFLFTQNIDDLPFLVILLHCALFAKATKNG